jgi:hypothetical protein
MALREQQRRSTDHAPWALLASGALWRLRREEPAQGAACLVLEGDGHQSPWGPITEGVPDNVRRMALWSTLEGCAVVVYTDQGATLWWLEPQSAAPSPPLVLQGARRVVARLDRGSLVVVDDRGRLLALDTRLREALTDIRL